MTILCKNRGKPVGTVAQLLLAGSDGLGTALDLLIPYRPSLERLDQRHSSSQKGPSDRECARKTAAGTSFQYVSRVCPCRFRYWAAKRAPFFQTTEVITAILRASVSRAISDRIPGRVNRWNTFPEYHLHSSGTVFAIQPDTLAGFQIGRSSYRLGMVCDVSPWQPIPR